MGRRCEPKLEAAWLPSLREGQDDWQVIAGSVARILRPRRAHRLARLGSARGSASGCMLPNYPFQRSRHWFTIDPSQRLRMWRRRRVHRVQQRPAANQIHPLLGSVAVDGLDEQAVRIAAEHAARRRIWPITRCKARRSRRRPPTSSKAWRRPTRCSARASTASRISRSNRRCSCRKACGDACRFRSRRSPAAKQRLKPIADRTTRTAQRPRGTCTPRERWCTNRNCSDASAVETNSIDLDAARDRAVTIMSRDEFYESMAERGLAYGPAFQVLTNCIAAWTMQSPACNCRSRCVREAAAYHLHPVLGDALLQSMAGVPLEEDGSFSPFTYMPVGIRSVRVLSKIEDFTAAAVCVCACAPAATRRPARNVSKPTSIWSTATATYSSRSKARKCSGWAAAARPDSSTDTSRWLYRDRLARRAARCRTNCQSRTAHGESRDKWLIFADSQGVGTKTGRSTWLPAASRAFLVEPAKEFASPLGKPTNGHPGRQARCQDRSARRKPLPRDCLTRHSLRRKQAVRGHRPPVVAGYRCRTKPSA